ncbi:hypothetical protein GEMRC1_005250 [Eukaryota sp. GEM-RC1]
MANLTSVAPIPQSSIPDIPPEISLSDIVFDPTDSGDIQKPRNAYAGFDIDEVVLLVAAVSKYIKVARSHRVNWTTVADGLGEGWTPERAQLIWRYIAYPHKRAELQVTPRSIVDGPEDGTYALNHEDSDWDGSGCRPQKIAGETKKEPKTKGKRRASEAFVPPPSPAAPVIQSALPTTPFPTVNAVPPTLSSPYGDPMSFNTDLGFLGDMW